MKNNKGFTLIEVIVIVVILASLMAVAVPISMSYIDDVNKQKIISEAQSIIYIAETYIDSNRSSLDGTYVQLDNDTFFISPNDDNILEYIVKKANGRGKIDRLGYNKDYKVIELKYEIDGKTVNYQASTGEYDVSP